MGVPVSNSQPVEDQIAPMPAHVLLSIARNPSSSREWRRAAVKLMQEKKYPEVNHPDLALIVAELNYEAQAQDEVESVVEAATEQPLTVVEVVVEPLQASVTTASLMQSEIIRNADALNEDALAE